MDWQLDKSTRRLQMTDKIFHVNMADLLTSIKDVPTGWAVHSGG